MKAKVTRYFRRLIKPAEQGEDALLFHIQPANPDIRPYEVLANARSYGLAVIEGSALWGDKSIAYMREDVWKETPHAPYGLGNKNNPLWPWVYCAADPSIYPYGSRLYVENLVGRTMPDGYVHNGLIYVADVGGAIIGEGRFDWMCGTEWLEQDLPLDLKSHDWDVEGWHPYKALMTVQAVQAALLRLGFWVAGSGQPDNLFGPKTRKALLDFQATIPEIPEIEFGRYIGPATTYYLGQSLDQREYLEEWINDRIAETVDR